MTQKPNEPMTSEESFAYYHALLAEKYPNDEQDRKEWKAATSEEQKKEICKRYRDWKDNQDRLIKEAIKGLVPAVGTPCTIVYYSDKRAATVTRIISPTKIAVAHNKTICKNWFSSDYEILPELEDVNDFDVFTKRSNGLWVMQGQSSKDGVLLCLHFQRHYIDPTY